MLHILSSCLSTFRRRALRTAKIKAPIGSIRIGSAVMIGVTMALSFVVPANLAGQTVITIANAGFESPTPTVFDDYTVGATGWTRTNNAIDAGTFAPGSSGVTPAPIDGSQVGYSNGFGGLQQVLSVTFSAGYSYTFSVYLGYRSDEINAPSGNGSIQLGYFDGTFTPLATQTGSALPGQFNFVTGTYNATLADQGRTIALRLNDTASVQVVFDHVQLTATAIPEPTTVAMAMGAVALGLAAWRTRRRGVNR